MLKTYKLSPDARPYVMRRRTLIVALVAIVLEVAYLLAFSSQNGYGSSDLLDFGTFREIVSIAGSALMSIAIVAAIIIFLVREMVKAAWKSFEIELGDDSVTLRQTGTPTTQIRRVEVTYLQEDSAGLLIHTASKYKLLGIPRTLDGYKEVRSVLTSWAPIRPPRQHVRVRAIVATILTLVGAVIVIFSFDFWLLLIANVILIGYCGSEYWQMRHQVMVDLRLKRGMLFMIGWVLFFDATKACFILGIPLLGK